MDSPLIEVRSISKQWTSLDLPIFSDVSFELHRGETYSCVGASGVGKSTLLDVIAGFVAPSSGSLLLKGKPLETWAPEYVRRYCFGFVFQAFHLLEEETALANILLPARIAREPTHDGSLYYKRACVLLERLSMEHQAGRAAKYLSGGEKQRVAIARALIMNPEILFADEPTGNVDEETSQHIAEILFEMVSLHNTTLFLVTHQEELAARCRVQYKLKNRCLINQEGNL